MADAGHILAQLEDGGGALAAYDAAVAQCTTRELLFAIELAKGARLADAHATARYRYRGSMRARAHDAYRIRQRPHVKTVERCLRRAAVHRAKVNAADVRAELARIAFSNINHYVMERDGRLKLAAGAPADAMRAVAWCDTRRTKGDGTERTATVLRRWNKLAALRLLAEDLGMLDANRAPNAVEPLRVIVEHMQVPARPALQATAHIADEGTGRHRSRTMGTLDPRDSRNSSLELASRGENGTS